MDPNQISQLDIILQTLKPEKPPLFIFKTQELKNITENKFS